MEAIIQAIARQAAKANAPETGDYRGADDLLYCGKCHTPKQCFVKAFGKTMKMPCMCRCRTEADERQKAEKAAEYAKKLRDRGGISLAYRFETADMTPEMVKCRRYAERWEEARQKNIGLLLWGDVGAGKTFAAHCICNALIDREEPVSVFATSLSRVLNSGFDKTEVIERIRRTPLVVFDDLGAERGSEYALETVFTLVDERYRAKKPLIVTSNVTLDEMKNPKDTEGTPDIRRKRIYDRVLEMCVPVYFTGGSKRRGIAADKKADMRKLIED